MEVHRSQFSQTKKSSQQVKPWRWIMMVLRVLASADSEFIDKGQTRIVLVVVVILGCLPSVPAYPHTDFVSALCSTDKIEDLDSSFYANLDALFYNLYLGINLQAGRWLATSDENFDENTAYGLASCNTALTHLECQECLDYWRYIHLYEVTCSPSVYGGQLTLVDCFMEYEHYPIRL
ncbi:hypothetical protein Mapa_001585 [Marchantia paleacea]|nr:hypothetical protein Mapa_001585 [Marchantia paleacea]